ncbi:MAG: hypothetical protein AVDCRST_MAG67-2396, partial [uncultured Solirubrobacteraceae bacterium]
AAEQRRLGAGTTGQDPGGDGVDDRAGHRRCAGRRL